MHRFHYHLHKKQDDHCSRAHSVYNTNCNVDTNEITFFVVRMVSEREWNNVGDVKCVERE